MDLLSPQSPAQHITVMKGAQLGFTECALNWMFYTVDHAPAPFLLVQKTIDNVTKLSKQRLDKSIRLTPSVHAKIGEMRSRDSQNTILIKNFPGGVLILGGANSPASLRSMPIQNLALDEEDSYEADIGEEGSPSELAIARTRNFPRRKIFRLSTPTIRETSVIEPNFESGSKERYHVPCPFCGKLQVIYWGNLKWEQDKPETVKLKCAHCEELIPEHFKGQMFEECRNYADPDAPGARWIAEDPDNPHKSFHISGLYSPLGFYSWQDAVTLFLKATRTFDKALLKVFVNTVLGETWTEAGKSLEANWVAKRKEPYAHAAPAGALLLTAGVDVQEDRLEYEVVGFGANEETWAIEYGTLMGDTETSFVWEQLDMALSRAYTHPSGHDVPIACVAVDSGHRAEVVYRYCRAREFRRVFPVKGFDGFGKGYIKRPMRRNEHGVWLFNVFVDEIKSKVYSQLQVEEPGPGFCHFPDYPEYGENYFKGLTAERLITARKGGRSVLRWECPKGRRNEPLDCRTYATAARYILNPNINALAQKGIPLLPTKRVAKRKRGRVISGGIS
jgi:phage terminase large subunit GpA-like protein